VTVSPGVTQNQNVGEARYTGVELGGSIDAAAWLSAGINYTYIDRESRSTPKRILFGVPKHAAFAWVEWHPLESLTIVPSATVNARRFSSDVAAAGGEPVGGFTTLDLRVSWRFLEHYRAELIGRNLADRLYQLDYGYPREGRSLSFVVRGNW
jgi:outer membrane receptor protein involved in Fe transport